ncbi:hypothetical protein NA56DRAFT_574223 [Hyaloscypha hepaticicola]|uniref:SAP domain-containing protein n=1 Tax=Hyaloscypha hepaticicola TaxID=2082293 RepID=A0A2J6Q2E3_9HELO|nr:hypothetical protein NA56DRAFT_574223 [Hyaloscypha hepaticicola]
MADYSSHKVPDLKKILQERGLGISGNKADLIARLQEDDKKAAGGAGAGGAGEDEIDWDEDDKPTTEPAAAAVAAGGQGAVPTPIAVPNQEAAVDPSTTSDLTTKEPAPTPSTDVTKTTDTTTAKDEAAAPEEPKPDFSIGLKDSDALTEAEKRAARAKRFGIPQNEEAKKLAERAKKFGLDSKDTVVKGLDSALPERKAKRGREGREEGRAAKRQTPDRRTGPKGKGERAGGGGGAGGKGKISDDPVERAKMEARAKKFGKPVPT